MMAAAVFRCPVCGELFVTDKGLVALMEHHDNKHKDRTRVDFIPV